MIFLSVPSFAYASTYYVNTSGSGNTCSQSAPCDLNTGLAKPVAGDTVLVAAGIYTQTVPDITKSGTAGASITYQAVGKAIIRSVYIAGNYINFRGFTVSDPTIDWGIRTSGDHLLVENNEIYNTKQDGIWFFGSDNIFRGNYIHDILDRNSTSDTHVDCFQGWGWNWNTTNVLFENNVCINNHVGNIFNCLVTIERESAAELRDITFRNNLLVIYKPVWASFTLTDVSNITVINNTIINMGTPGNNTVAGITDVMSNMTFVNNLFINFGSSSQYQHYISDFGGTNVSIHNNAIYNTDGSAPGGSPYPGDIWLKNPLIVRFPDAYGLNGDFHLQAGSPLIGAGSNLGNSVVTDIESNPRPSSGGYTIGAYEYVSGLIPSPTPSPVPKPGDATGDGNVNAADMAKWLYGYIRNMGGLTNGDFDGNGNINGKDFLIWLNNYGK